MTNAKVCSGECGNIVKLMCIRAMSTLVFHVKVAVNLLEEAKPMRVRAALSRDGVEVYGDHVNIQPREARTILLLVSVTPN